MNAPHRSLAFILSLTFLLATPAYAQPAEDPAAAGRAAYALGNYAAAATAFEEAFQKTPTAALLYNAAQAHRLAGDKARALELYRNYVRVYGRKGKNYREAQHHVGVLEPEVQRELEARPAPPPVTAAPPAPSSPPAPLVLPPLPPPTAPAPSSTSAPPAAVVATPAPEPQPAGHGPLFWTAIGVGVVVLAGGATALLLSRRQPTAPTGSLGTVPGN